MRPQMADPTAGERAREIWAHPSAPQLIVDPTDTRCGTLSPQAHERAGDAQLMLDPTDARRRRGV